VAPKSRQSLIHVGVSANNDAFIEIHFDNKKRQLPIEKDEVIVRRSFNLHKDEFFIDRKHTTRNDVRVMFDSIGLSLKQGLFIIKQGKVKEVSEMNDNSRLMFLLDAAGFSRFDEQRSESLKIMSESHVRRDKIGESIKYIDERLEKLRLETEELAKYEELERNKKAIEFLVHEHHRDEAENEILKLNEERSDEGLSLSSIRTLFDDYAFKIHAKEVEIGELKLKSSLMKTNVSECVKNMADLKKKEQKLLNIIEDRERKLSTSNIDNEVSQKTIDELEQKVQSFEQKKVALSDSIRSLKWELSELQVFFTEPSEINSIEKSIADSNREIQMIKDSIINTKEVLTGLESDAEKYKTEEDNLSKYYNEHQSEVEFLKKSRHQRIERRKSLWQDESITKKKLHSVLSRIEQTNSSIEHRIGSETRQALSFIKANNFEGVYGPLIDLFTYDSEYAQAIESVTRSKLFYMVAENQEIAKDLLNRVEKSKSGRISVFVLDKIRIKNSIEIPTTPTISPLISHIKTEEKFFPIFNQILGSIGVCPNLSLATDESSNYKINTISLSGDFVMYGGAMTGGYHDNSKSILGHMTAISQLRDEENGCKNKLEYISENLSRIEEELNQNQHEIRFKETDSLDIKRKIIEIQDKISFLNNEINTNHNSLQRLNLEHDKAQQDFETHIHTREVLKKDKPELESSEIVAITEKITIIEEELFSKTMMLSGINEHLISLSKRLKDTKANYHSNNNKQLIVDLETFRLNLESLRVEISQVSDNFEIMKKESQNTQDEVNDQEKELSGLQKSFLGYEKRILMQQQRIDTINNKIALLTHKKDEICEKINLIVPFPSSSVEEHRNFSYTELQKKMCEISEEMPLFRYVNKKANEQFVQFETKRQELVQSLSDIDESKESISQLIVVLDEKKKSAFESFFQKLSDNFSSIFHRLMPDRFAQLVLQHSNILNDVDAQSENIAGCAIKIDHVPIEQMSGGQKTLVALSLLLAIQKTDPSPFYLFDEIDADLDPAHRKAVASLIEEMSSFEDNESTQFIYSTFKDELSEIAERHFGFSSNNNATKVIEMAKFEAFQFIHDDNQVLRE